MDDDAYHLFDFGELSSVSRANPGGLREKIFASGVPAGKAPNVTAADVFRTRWAIATAYALGAQMLVPWGI